MVPQNAQSAREVLGALDQVKEERVQQQALLQREGSVTATSVVEQAQALPEQVRACGAEEDNLLPVVVVLARQRRGQDSAEGLPNVLGYWNERDHPVAHFHAYQAGRRASVSADGEVPAGGLEPRALQFVREWAVLRRAEIVANWERARRNEPLRGIDPLA